MIASLELRGHLAFQLDDGISVDHRPFAVADELKVDRIGGWELAGDVEDHLRQPWRLLDRRAGRAALERPVVSDHRVEALVPHHVGGLELPGRPVFPARVLDSSVGHDADGVGAKRCGLLGLGCCGGRAGIGDDQTYGFSGYGGKPWGKGMVS